MLSSCRWILHMMLMNNSITKMCVRFEQNIVGQIRLVWRNYEDCFHPCSVTVSAKHAKGRHLYLMRRSLTSATVPIIQLNVVNDTLGWWPLNQHIAVAYHPWPLTRHAVACHPCIVPALTHLIGRKIIDQYLIQFATREIGLRSNKKCLLCNNIFLRVIFEVGV